MQQSAVEKNQSVLAYAKLYDNVISTTYVKDALTHFLMP